MTNPKNIIFNPTERWYRNAAENETGHDISAGMEIYFCKDSNGNDVPIFFGYEEYKVG